jgi:glycosyltransferase involved in cell wall biosynthesis
MYQNTGSKVCKSLSVVIPVFNNAASIQELINAINYSLVLEDCDKEFVFVVDGSEDLSHSLLIASMPLNDASCRIIQLSRNFGSISAVRVGLAESSGDVVAVMAADLQEPIEILAEFFNALRFGNFDVVIGQRRSRSDPLISKFMAQVYWRLYRRFINSQIPVGGVDVFAVNTKVKNVLISLKEGESSLVGLLFWIGFRRTSIEYDRLERPYGKSAWTLKRKFRYFSDSVFAFTNAPIIFLQAIGGLGLLCSLFLSTVTYIGYSSGKIETPGYTSLIIAILFSSSIITLGLGIVGNYAWRAYENTKGRPLAIIANQQYSNSGKK